MKPRFEHDCRECVFLGHFEDRDLYFCGQHGRPTVIARASSTPADYSSGMPFAQLANPDNGLYPLRVAMLLASDRGLFTESRG